MTQLDDRPAELVKAEKRVKAAGIAGCALALLTVLQFLFPFVAGLSPAAVAAGLLHAALEGEGNPDPFVLGMPPIYLFTIISLLIIILTTIGIFRKHTLSSVILFTWAIVAFVFSLSITSVRLLIPVFVIAAILVFLFFGMLGTFDYHQIKEGVRESGQK